MPRHGGECIFAAPMTTMASARCTIRSTWWTALATPTGFCEPTGGFARSRASLRPRPGAGPRPIRASTRRWPMPRCAGSASARRPNGTPWVLFSSMVSPHYPLIAPDAFYDLYDGVELPGPRLYVNIDHPVSRNPTGGRATSRTSAALTWRDTLVYTSDHARASATGLWGKSVMYEEASAVPLVAAPSPPANDARLRSRWSTSTRRSSKRSAGRSMSASAPCPGRAWSHSRGRCQAIVSQRADDGR